MKKQLQALLDQSLRVLESEGMVITVKQDDIKIEYSRDPLHGDFASNLAMVLAKSCNCNPRELANRITENLPKSDLIKRTEIAGPGFINFFLNQNSYQSVVLDILEKGETYGNSKIGDNQSTLIEFVSANPTGPLHIGHGRGAAYGAAIANLLKKTGFNIHCEYYVNDSGRQMDILTVSAWMRYLQQHDKEICFPENAYKGHYITDIAADLKNKYANKFVTPHKDILDLLDKKEEADIKIDKLIKHCASILGMENYRLILETCLDSILSSIKNDLSEFGVEFNNWYSEYSLLKNNSVNQCIAKLNDRSWVYQKDGAEWFRSSKLGDEKDRVLVRENGQKTYFASDIAYHLSKFERGYKKIINIWGADHHGYIERIKASMKALDYPPEAIRILLVQFATLFRGKEKLQMSTRSGEFITLKELINEVGKDAARFIMLNRSNDAELDFDFSKVKEKSKENHLYYVQYCYARISSVFRHINKNLEDPINIKKYNFNYTTDEIRIFKKLAEWPVCIKVASNKLEPHRLPIYLYELASEFHSYWNLGNDNEKKRFIDKNNKITDEKLVILKSVSNVIKIGLDIIGVNSPKKM